MHSTVHVKSLSFSTAGGDKSRDTDYFPTDQDLVTWRHRVASTIPRIAILSSTELQNKRICYFTRFHPVRAVVQSPPTDRANPMATSEAADTVTPAAADTIELLETRLRRIEYLLTGDSSWSGESVDVSTEKTISQKDSVTARLASLENELNRLSGKVPAVRDMLRLCMLLFFPYYLGLISFCLCLCVN